MSYPILYKSTETEFTSNGIGVLSDTVSCIVTEERNGSFELQMKYPIDGIHYSDIQDRSLIMAKPNPIDEAQPFRVYRTTKPLNGMVSIYARHISYDLSGIPVSPFGATNIVDAFQKLKTNAVTDCPFTFWTNKATSANMSVKVPSPIRSLLGGQSGSVLDVYGGEYKFDRYTVRLYDHRGTDRGVSIRYGKNLLDLEQERNCASVYTGLYPYWTDMDGNNMVTLPEKIVNTPGSYDYVNIMTIDFSEQWENAPTVGQLRARAESYIKSNNIGVPSVSLTVSHAMLEQTEEYKGMALLERIDLCDTVSIEFPKLGVSASAKANKTEFNVLLDRYESIEFGDARKTLTDTIIEQNQEVRGTKDFARSLVSQASDKLNEAMQNASGLYPTEDVQPDGSVIYYLHDKKVLEESSIVIKVSNEGIGLSSDGGKTYPYGYTVTGNMVMDFIAANGIVANWVTSGELNLGLLKLIGTICGLMQGYGATKSGKTTEGIVMYGNGVDTDGNAKPPYIIVTNAGIRGQSDADHDFNMAAGALEVNGAITSSGNIHTDGAVTSGDGYWIGDYRAVRLGPLDQEEKNQVWFGNTNADNVYIEGKKLYINKVGLDTYLRGTVHVQNSAWFDGQVVVSGYDLAQGTWQQIQTGNGDYVTVWAYQGGG